jgi:signal transduction histidine kinase
VRALPASLRHRLVLGAVAVGLTFAVLFGLGASWLIQRAEDQAVRAALQSRVELARDEVASDGSLRQDAGSPKTDLVQVIAPDGTVRAGSPSLSGLDPLVDLDQVTAVGGYRTSVALQQPDVDLALLAVPVHLTSAGSSPNGTGALVVGVDAEGFNSATSQLRWLLVVGLVIVVIAVGLLSWVLTGRALRSVTRLTESAEEVGPNDLATGLPVPPHDAELARLVGALNRMLVRLHESHLTELTFAADAGHRLRTPVATLRAEAELALREHDTVARTAALENIVQDADQLTSIVERMLARSRSRSHAPEPVTTVLQETGERWRRRAQLSAVSFDLHIHESVVADCRCPAILDVLEPVVDNAIRHSPAGGLVRVEVRAADDRPARAENDREQLVFMVTNTGEGIPEDLSSRIFDAWVSGRDASVAGGLGLWLARETARDVGGDVTLTEAGPGTCTFRVTLPVARPGLTRSGHDQVRLS